MDTVDACDREIARLAQEIAVVKRLRKTLVKRAEMAEKRHNPAFVARWRHGMAIAAADPVRRAIRSANASQGQKNSAKGLPPMTRRQHLDYRKLRRHTNFTRDEALAEVFRNSGAQAHSPPGSRERRDAACCDIGPGQPPLHSG